MTSVQRHRHGAVDPEVAPVLAATVVEIGDMCWFDATNNVVKPASDFTWDTDLATTQLAFKKVYCGVALSAHKLNDAVNLSVRLGTEGTYEYPCASAAFDLGTFLGPAKQSGNLLENQKLAAVATATLGVGQPARQYTSAVTKLMAKMLSTIHHSGVQTVT